MPYIAAHNRPAIRHWVDGLADAILTAGGARCPVMPGLINYAVCRLLWCLWHEDQSYRTWSVARGDIENALDEFRRRIVDPYEDGKRETNGDFSERATP